MIYRVILKVSYYEAWFDFDNIEDAGDFVKNILTHQSESDDSKPKSMVRIEVINTEAMEENEDD